MTKVTAAIIKMQVICSQSHQCIRCGLSTWLIAVSLLTRQKNRVSVQS